MVDMRKRFRGNQPIGVSPEFGGEKPGQLYGGKNAVGDIKPSKQEEEEGGERG